MAKRHRAGWRITLVTFSIIIMSALFFVIYAFYYMHGKCVRLENGLNIGFEAIFDVSRPYFRPSYVPRFSDGTPLVGEDIWPIYITDTTLYGTVASSQFSDIEHYKIAWRANTGVVIENENSELFDEIVSKSGTKKYGTDQRSVSTGVIFLELEKRPEFAGQKCRTRWVTW